MVKLQPWKKWSPMSNALQNSLLWRFVLWLYLSWKHSGLRHLGRGMRKSFRVSKTKHVCCGLLARPTSIGNGSKITHWGAALNRVLSRFGHKFMPIFRGSIVYRLYALLFRWGSNSKLLGILFRGGLTSFILAAVGLYALVDFALRDVLAIPVISSVWDEGLLLLSILFLIYTRIRAVSPLPTRHNPMDTPIFMFLGVGMALLFIVSPYFSIALDGYRATVQYILWFFVLTRLIRDDRDLMTLYLVLVMGAFLISLHGIYQYVVATPIPSTWTDQAENSVRTRVFSIFGSPNIMGDFMVMFAPMAAGLAYWFKDKRAKIFFWIVTFSMCFACLFTMSRGAWAAMAVAILIFALIVDRRLLILMLIGAVLALFLPFVASRIGYMLSPEYAESTANGGRSSRSDIALSYLATNPVFGFGQGMFGGAIAMQNQVFHWVSYFYVDNYYLKILVEMGYLGFGGFIFMLISLIATSLRSVYRASKAPKESAMTPLCAGMFAGLCGVLLHCTSENIFEEPYMMAYFWSIVAMIVYIGFFRNQKNKSQ